MVLYDIECVFVRINFLFLRFKIEYLSDILSNYFFKIYLMFLKLWGMLILEDGLKIWEFRKFLVNVNIN